MKILKNIHKYSILCSIFLVNSPIVADSFADYKKNQQAQADKQQKEFEDYAKAERQAFSDYKKVHEKALADYQKDIAKHWQSIEVSDKTQWVSYDDDFQQKTVIDFDKNTITIRKVVDKKDLAKTKKSLKKSLQDIQTLTYKKAYQKNPVDQTADKFMRQKINTNLTKQAEPSKDVVPILATRPDLKAAKISVVTKKDKAEVSITYRLKSKDIGHRIKALLPTVIQQAKKQRLPPALVLAFIKNESAFNPLAKSHIPAYGLMQIVPRSAGKDASAYLFGKSKLLSAGYLYNPDRNIEMGVAYLHILYYRYLKSIRNKQSKLYCTIAAYNTGSGNVAKSFIGNYNIRRAAKTINQKTSKEVYQHLIKNLPYEETRHYLKKVYRSYGKYKKLFY